MTGRKRSDASRASGEIAATRTTDFLASLGAVSSVNARGEKLAETIANVTYLGLRWLRAGYEDDVPVADLEAFHRETGALLSYGLLSGKSDIGRLVKDARALAEAGALLAVEGANEPNNWGVTYGGVFGGARESWLPVAELHRDLYAAVKSDPVLKNYPVWGLSENGAQTDNVGLQYLKIPEGAGALMPDGTVYADFANCHNYIAHPSWPGMHDNQTWLSSDPTKACRVDGLYGNYGVTWLNGFPRHSEDELPDLPRVTTETGIMPRDEVTDELQACLYLNLYLSQFKRGWSHTAVYLLKGRANEPGHEGFAFYRLDNTPRTVAHTMHNFTTILADPGGLSEPGSLGYSIPDQPETVHDLLLQNSSGAFTLVLWGERFTGGEDAVTVDLSRTFRTVNVYDPTTGIEPAQSLSNTATLQLVLTNHPLIIEFQ